MNFFKTNKMIIIFYLLVICFTYVLTMRVEKLDNKEDYYTNSKNVVINFGK